jgi:hypothetical protein
VPIPAGGTSGDQLATVADLQSLLGYTVDTDKATVLIECATAVVQAVAQQRIVQVVDDVQTIDLDEHDEGLYLYLPERPVTAVSAAVIGATPVTDYTQQLTRNRLWRAYGWRSTLIRYVPQPSQVTITYTHGYPAGHQRLQLARSAVLSLIKGVYGNATGATRVAIDDYSAMYEALSAQMDASEFLQKVLRRQYARPPGSAVLTTRG